MVFKDRNDILRTRVFEQLCPGLRIVMLGLEHGDEILVAKLGQRAVRSRRDAYFPPIPRDTSGADTTHCRKQERNRRPSE